MADLLCPFCDQRRCSPKRRPNDSTRTLKEDKRIEANSLKCVLILSTIVLGMSTRNGLGDLLFGRTRGAILALLYGRAGQSFYTRQIACEVDASVGAVQRELENLSKVGLIIRNSLAAKFSIRRTDPPPYFERYRPW